MSLLQLYLLGIIGFVGIICNWLLILGIQRKIYHYQHSHRIPSPAPHKSLLRTQSSLVQQGPQPPLLPSIRSSVSMFDKFILAFLINDIFACNFLLPLRLLDLAQGLPCGFLCFIFKLFEKLSIVVELILINLLLIASLIFFWKKRLLTTKLWIILIACTIPILIGCLTTAFTYVDVEEYETRNRPATCKQTHLYVNPSTQKNCNSFCCFMSYIIILISFGLLIKMRYAIRVYRQHTLKNLTETAASMRNEALLFDQSTNDPDYRRSMYYSISVNLDPPAPNATPPVRRSCQPIDYLAYLTIIENSHTLVRSTCLILLIYFFAHIPYWLSEVSPTEFSTRWKDIFFLSHILKPFCYILTNEKYRLHVWAVMQCQTFRMLPNLLRRKSRVLNLNNNVNLSSNF